MGAMLGAMLGGHLAGALVFVAVARLLSTVQEARKQVAEAEGESSPRRLALLVLSQSLFHSAPWLILAAGVFSYHVFGESWAPWFFGGFALVVVFLGIVVTHAATRKPSRPDDRSLAAMVDLVPMERTEDAFEFALAVKKEAFGPHIMKRWGWDEELQRRTHSERWEAKRFFRILRDGASIGTVSIDEAPDHLRVGEFYIFSSHHGQGVGTAVLARILRDADARHLPVRLKCLKWNPALSLYRRHDFVVTHDSETHFFMERPGTGGGGN